MTKRKTQLPPAAKVAAIIALLHRARELFPDDAQKRREWIAVEGKKVSHA